MADVLQELKDVETKEDGKFSFQNQKVLYTYKTHIDKIQLKLFFDELEKGKTIKFWRAAHEAGTNDPITPYLHTHVLVDFGYRRKTTNVREWDYKDEKGIIHPHIKKVTTPTHWKKCLKYIAKEDPENVDLKVEPTTFIERINGYETRQEALKAEAKTPQMVSGVMAAYAARPQMVVREVPPLWEWQEQLVKDFLECKSDRKIFWLYDTNGGIGKTILCDYLETTLGGEKCITLSEAPGSYHTATIIQRDVENGWDGSYIVFDFSRMKEGRDSIYDPLEQLKNGRMTSAKYQGARMLFKYKPQILVMANFLPEFRNMTMDRWDVRIPTGPVKQMYGPGGLYHQFTDPSKIKLKPYRPTTNFNIMSDLVGELPP